MHFSFSRIDYSCFFVFFCLYNWNFVLSTLFSIHPENCTIVIMIILIRLKNFTFLFIVKSTEILVIIVTFNPHATKHFQSDFFKGRCIQNFNFVIHLHILYSNLYNSDISSYWFHSSNATIKHEHHLQKILTILRFSCFRPI